MTPQALLAPARLAGRPVLRTQSDERLVDLARAGYEPAFEAIVARYRRPLQRYCGRFLPDERSEDAVQQTFVNAYGALRQTSAEISLRPWLYRIAHNTSLNALRDRALGYEQLDERYDGVERPEEALERRQGLRDLLAAVQALPERQRDAIVLRELEGRSYEEIAGELGVTGGAVRQLLNRARNTLRAAATAVTPVGVLTRLPWADPAEPVAARVAEVCAGAGAGAVAAKVGAAALVTGAVAGGVAVAPQDDGGEKAKARDRPAESGAAKQGGQARRSEAVAPVATDDRTSGRRGRGDRSGPSDSSGPGSGGSESGGDRSGSNSGPGSGSSGSGSEEELDSSGSSGSGSGSSGSGSSGSGSSGSGSSGSGSDSSGSGSGSPMMGSSGSGSGSEEELDSSGSGSSGSG
jgi:RNA polymerase sigma factor (sigma-70 family)